LAGLKEEKLTFHIEAANAVGWEQQELGCKLGSFNATSTIIPASRVAFNIMIS